MGEAIGQVLPLAVGVALSPVPIIAVVLMLVTGRFRSCLKTPGINMDTVIPPRRS